MLPRFTSKGGSFGHERSSPTHTLDEDAGSLLLGSQSQTVARLKRGVKVQHVLILTVALAFALLLFKGASSLAVAAKRNSSVLGCPASARTHFNPSHQLPVRVELPTDSSGVPWQPAVADLATLRDGMRSLADDLAQSTHTEVQLATVFQKHRRFYPWLRSLHFGTGRGMAVCVGNHQFDHIVPNIRAIRYLFNASMPFEIFHMGAADLDPEKAEILERFPDVVVRDLTKVGPLSGHAFAY